MLPIRVGFDKCHRREVLASETRTPQGSKLDGYVVGRAGHEGCRSRRQVDRSGSSARHEDERATADGTSKPRPRAPATMTATTEPSTLAVPMTSPRPAGFRAWRSGLPMSALRFGRARRRSTAARCRASCGQTGSWTSAAIMIDEKLHRPIRLAIARWNLTASSKVTHRARRGMNTATTKSNCSASVAYVRATMSHCNAHRPVSSIGHLSPLGPRR